MKYRISDCIPDKFTDLNQNEPLHNSAINRAIAHIQKVAEGQTFDGKITLSKYSCVAEDQRKIVHKKREKILYDNDALAVLEKANPAKMQELLAQVSENEFKCAQKAIELFVINQCWADHLLIIESALDEVQIISQAKQDPFLFYNRKLVDGFDCMEKHIHDMILEIFDTLKIKNGHIDLDEMGIKGPSSTRTYMVNDGTEQSYLINGIAAMTSPLYMFYLLIELFDKHTKHKK